LLDFNCIEIVYVEWFCEALWVERKLLCNEGWVLFLHGKNFISSDLSKTLIIVWVDFIRMASFKK
jgi:hypothetical protein